MKFREPYQYGWLAEVPRNVFESTEVSHPLGTDNAFVDGRKAVLGDGSRSSA